MEPRSGASPAFPVVLAVAGFDPTGGAGASADLKTLAAHNCHGVAVLTSLTIQSTGGVTARHDIAAAVVAGQIRALAEDMPLAAVKIGMLGSAENVEAVAAAIAQYAPPFVVLDPVLHSSNGAELLDADAVDILRDRLLSGVSLITPNLDEAARLSGMPVGSVEAMKAAAAELYQRHGARVVVTGGHLEKPQDVFYDGSNFTVFAGDRVRSPNTHGTGCAFSSAIAANVALGKSLPDAIMLAKAFVTRAIERGFAPGRGRGLLNHLYRLQPSSAARVVMAEPHDAQSAHR